jgi:hypothetical protein
MLLIALTKDSSCCHRAGRELLNERETFSSRTKTLAHQYTLRRLYFAPCGPVSRRVCTIQKRAPVRSLLPTSDPTRRCFGSADFWIGCTVRGTGLELPMPYCMGVSSCRARWACKVLSSWVSGHVAST